MNETIPRTPLSCVEGRNFRLLALDLDGTVLTDEKELLPQVKAAIKAARAAGLMVVLCTGRAWQTSFPMIEELELDPSLPAVVLGGSLVKVPSTGQVLHRQHLDAPTVRALAAAILPLGLGLIVYREDTLCTPQITPDTQAYEELVKSPVRFIPEYLDTLDTHPVFKYAVLSSPENIRALRKQCENFVPPGIFYYSPRPFLTEFESREASKHQALKRVCQHLGVPLQETVAIGDNINDLGMLQMAGLGIAMGNAAQNIRDEADWVTLENSEGGVGYALETLLKKMH